jgi:membrane protease subunit (stomatin/prohibitin family)
LDEIKNNSSLIVDPGLAAIFIHNGKIEAIQTQAGKWSLETDNTPFLSSMKNIMSGFETHDKAAVYFVKTNKLANQKWGTPNSVTYVDPTYNFPVELRAFGNFTFKLADLENFWVNYVANSAEVQTDDIRMLITDRIVGHIAALFAKKKVSYNEIDAYTVDIANELMEVTKSEFGKLGLELTDFRIEDINFTDKTNAFIDKITSKSADVGAINKTANIDRSAMANYSEVEKLNIMNKAAESG